MSLSLYSQIVVFYNFILEGSSMLACSANNRTPLIFFFRVPQSLFNFLCLCQLLSPHCTPSCWCLFTCYLPATTVTQSWVWKECKLISSSRGEVNMKPWKMNKKE